MPTPERELEAAADTLSKMTEKKGSGLSREQAVTEVEELST